MVIEFIRLELLKKIRSSSFAKSVLIAFFLGLVVLLLLGYVLILGLVLDHLIREVLNKEDPILFLNSILIYFFLFEIIYRYFIQSLPVIELEYFLHLPIRKSKIIHFLLIKSFFSPLSILPVLLFTPFALTTIADSYGIYYAIFWLSSVFFTSWSIHWGILWFKQRFEDSLISVMVLFVLVLLSAGSSYFGSFDLGAFFEPVFTFALESPVPVVLLCAVMVCTYFLCFAFYRQNAYLEDLSEDENIRFVNRSIGIFHRFGLAGEMANLEWKLILRHKKSRTFLTLCVFFLLYGLIFYTNPAYQSDGDGFSYMFIFVGAFMTGIFMFQYGQLFLSWNSGNFDFFLRQREGLEALVRGKYILFVAISCVCFLLTVPYAFFGWEFLLIHFVTFLFNIGITMHMVVLLALWKPKPMDLNKGGVFNYEGVGLAQFLMIIPMVLAPYFVFLPFAGLLGDFEGLLALGAVGMIGIIAFPKLTSVAIQKVFDKRYEISSAFRQEL